MKFYIAAVIIKSNESCGVKLNQQTKLVLEHF